MDNADAPFPAHENAPAMAGAFSAETYGRGLVRA